MSSRILGYFRKYDRNKSRDFYSIGFDLSLLLIILSIGKSRETNMNQEKRGRGRPKKQDEQKSYTHGVSCTPDQWATLQKMAQDQNISISRLILKLAQIGTLFGMFSCTSNSGYYPSVKAAEENNSLDKTTHYAKRLSRRTKRRGPCSIARYTRLSTRLFFAPLDTVHPCRLSESCVIADCGVKK